MSANKQFQPRTSNLKGLNVVNVIQTALDKTGKILSKIMS